jgi:hypothetical protein
MLDLSIEGVTVTLPGLSSPRIYTLSIVDLRLISLILSSVSSCTCDVRSFKASCHDNQFKCTNSTIGLFCLVTGAKDGQEWAIEIGSNDPRMGIGEGNEREAISSLRGLRIYIDLAS